MRMAKYITVVVLSVMVVSGCASNPIAKNLREQSRPLTLNQVTANPKTTSGTIVIWGGRIIETVNNTNGGAIYVLQRPLRRGEKPVNDDIVTGGRFIAVSHEHLDPATFSSGRLITIAGRIIGVRNERVQNAYNLYPVVDVKQTYVWATRPKQQYYYYYGQYPNDPLRGDGGVGWYYPTDGTNYDRYMDQNSRSGGQAR